MLKESTKHVGATTVGRSYYFALAAAFVLALLLRVGMTATFQGLNSPPDYDANPDQADYELFAFNLSQGKGYCLSPGTPSACRPPGTALTLLPAYAAVGRSFFCGRLWMCLLSAATCVATAEVARHSFGPATAILSAFWLSVYPGHFYYAMHFLSEVPFCLLLTLACGFTIPYLKRGGWTLGTVAGVLWGLAVLTRPQILIMAPLGLLFAFLTPASIRWTTLGRALYTTALVGIVLAPWIARNAMVMGKPTVCTIVGGYGFWLGNNELVADSPKYWGTCAVISDLVDVEHPLSGSEVEREELAWQYGKQFITSHPDRMPLLCLGKLWRFVSPLSDTPNVAVFWSFAIAWSVTLPLAVFGVIAAFFHEPSSAAVLLLPVLAMLATTIVFYGLDRYRDSLSPVFVIFACYGVVDLWKRGLIAISK